VVCGTAASKHKIDDAINLLSIIQKTFRQQTIAQLFAWQTKQPNMNKNNKYQKLCQMITINDYLRLIALHFQAVLPAHVCAALRRNSTAPHLAERQIQSDANVHHSPRAETVY
jgi:hypothetical protein